MPCAIATDSSTLMTNLVMLIGAPRQFQIVPQCGP
jgi:hypothetical protein